MAIVRPDFQPSLLVSSYSKVCCKLYEK